MKSYFTLKTNVFAALLLAVVLIAIANSECVSADNPNPPENPIRLVFIHHSTGGNWLANDYGGLGRALMRNNYYVSDVCYGWGLNGIGDRTDLGHWWEWFRDPEYSAAYIYDIFHVDQIDGQYGEYERLSSNPDPEGENVIIMFKSCFPNSMLRGNPDDPIPPIHDNPMRGEWAESESYTVANAKGIYIDILNYFRTKQDKLFIVITAPPLSDPTYSANARAFNLWLVNDWLKDYQYKNVFVYDFFNALTTNGGNPQTNDLNSQTGNHHRWWNNQVQHLYDGKSNTLKYPSGDDHPNEVGNAKTTEEFLPLLNVAYNRWANAGTDVDVKQSSNDKEQFFDILPNPVNSSSVISYRIPAEATISFSINNIMGQIIYKFKVATNSSQGIYEYDFSKLEHGFYFIYINTRWGQEVLPFIKL